VKGLEWPTCVRTDGKIVRYCGRQPTLPNGQLGLRKCLMKDDYVGQAGVFKAEFKAKSVFEHSAKAVHEAQITQNRCIHFLIQAYCLLCYS
jgi:hypothetical protein